jgi:sugar lactone lactonase YvrE
MSQRKESNPLAGMAWTGSGPASAETQDSAATFPDVLPLPNGFQPEGIVTGRGSDFFVVSVANGAIYRGDLRTGEGEVFVPPTDDRVAVGLSYDRRSNNLFVAGDGAGKAFVYDAETGETAAVYDLTDPGTFVNDVTVTSEAAYFTDSSRPFLYQVPLGPAGQLPDQSAVWEIQLGSDFEFIEGEFNANGIDAPPSGDYLIIVNSTAGLLYKVDPASGSAEEIDLGGETLTNGDGILLDGRTLYVVRNQNNVIAVVRLESEATQGEVVREITDSQFDVPTMIAEFGNALYAVNARFGISDPENATYSVIRVPKDDAPNDVDVLNFALTLEHLEAAYYNEFLEEYSESEVERSDVAQIFADDGSRFSTYQKIRTVRDHEEAHVEALTSTIEDLGGEPVEPAEYEFPYDSIEEFAALSATIEAVGVSAYAGAAPLIESDAVLKAAASVHSVEARHTAYFNVLNTTSRFSNAFDEPRSMEEVLEISSQFIVSE